ncbi:hypothetical protein NLJ89_g4211 [Agrocybe chaxingu]|uniref:RNI-like protein n=1 Tax=Agrocybe chaxingu TaxID=84603 RepID=A0A9W8MY47_9AGAR|nr:hypothetical protein NLJ89_g4211 [Agrocybe chaxingu]
MANFRVLDFRHRQLKLDTAQDVRDLFQDVVLAQVEVLRLSGNTIGAAAGQELGELIRKMPSLQVAHLSDIITSRSIEEVPPAISSICDALLTCPRLVELDLSDNAFGSRVAPALVPLLSGHTGIQVLKLNNNGLGPEGGRIVASALLDNARKAAKEFGPEGSKLRVVVCGRNRLEDGSAQLWGEVLAAHKNLQKVKMVNNGFREDGVLAVAKGLSNCHDLRHLSLRDSTAHNFDGTKSRRGWHVLADVIRRSTSLEYLDLSDTNLTAEGSSEIIESLSLTPHPDLEAILLENSDLNNSHYSRLRSILDTRLPALAVLDIALNEDLEEEEDGNHLKEIIEIIEERGGKVHIEEPSDEDDVQRDQIDKEREKKFVVFAEASWNLEGGDGAGIGESEDVDKLAEMMSGGLKI